jgi:hypothetical protein
MGPTATLLAVVDKSPSLALSRQDGSLRVSLRGWHGARALHAVRLYFTNTSSGAGA